MFVGVIVIIQLKQYFVNGKQKKNGKWPTLVVFC